MTSIISLALREWKGIVIIFLDCSIVSNPVQEKQNLLLTLLPVNQNGLIISKTR